MVIQSRFQDNFVAPNLSDPRLASKRAYRMLIDGKSVDAQSGETVSRESPGHRGKVVGEWPAGSTADAGLAIAAARKAFDHGPWPKMSGAERSTILHAVAAKILAHVDELGLIECLETGKPLEQARGEIGYCADLWNYAAGMSRGLEGATHNNIGENRLGLVLREPAGVVGIITPWNFPFIIVSERVPWALGAGCTVVVKPSEFTSGTTIRLAELALEAGLPAGVFNVITGYGPAVGQGLAEDPRVDVLAFTGSVRVGTQLAGIAAAGVKRVGLELGGKGPQVVFADADLEAAADGIALTDYDVLGRLYDPAQWAHAFGPSQLANPVPFEQSDAAKIWRASGRSGKPCASCNLITGYMTMIGSMIHNAGPNLNPLTIEKALVGNRSTVGGWEASGGNPSQYLIKFGPEDYNAISDFREVYWDAAARSGIDGKNGAYVSMNGGRRYAGGQLDTTFTIPAKPQ